MSSHQTQNIRKRCILPSKPSLNNFIINISQVKGPYNQQIKKRHSTQKAFKKASKRLQSAQEQENDSCLIQKNGDEVILLPTKSTKLEFSVNSIESYILGSASKQERKRYVYNVYRGVIYSQIKLRPPSEDFVNSHKVFLSEPTGSSKKFLLLDLDETLIHTQRGSEEGSKTSYRFMYRPHLFPFLERMGQLFEVYVFTAAQRSYAEAVVRKLNRGRLLVRDVMHREHCFETRKGRFLKDLRIVGNRSLQDIVIIDNLVESFGLQLTNGVPILEFAGATQDKELLNIIPLMERISQAEDVRTVLKEVFRLENVGGLDRKELQAYFQSAE